MLKLHLETCLWVEPHIYHACNLKEWGHASNIICETTGNSYKTLLKNYQRKTNIIWTQHWKKPKPTYEKSETNQLETQTQTWKNLKRAESEANVVSEDLKEQRNKKANPKNTEKQKGRSPLGMTPTTKKLLCKSPEGYDK